MDPVTIALGLAQFAPQIMRFFGAGEKSTAVAEKVVGIAQTVSGAKSPAEALEALKQNQELAAKFQEAVLAADTALEQAYLADRSDARKRDIQVRQLTGGYNWRADVMILACVAAIIYMVYAINSVADIKAEVLAIFNMAIGALLKMLGDAFAFEFGSSRGSKEKDQRLAGPPR